MDTLASRTTTQDASMDWLLADISSVLQCDLEPRLRDVRVRFITTDSRRVGPGDVFVALVGERFDGHDFLSDVIAAGAVAVVVSRPVSAACVQCLVPDTRAALGKLAAAWRKQWHGPVVAVAGSNGKTTTKEMIASMLRAEYGDAKTLATAGNFNNDIGVPLSVLRLRPHHAVAVFELGMNHPGEIAQLAYIVAPTVALVTNAQREHQEFMQSVAAVAEENGQVFRFLQPGGVAIFPGDEPFGHCWQAQAGSARQLQFFAGAASPSEPLDDHCTYVQTSVSGQPSLQGPWGQLRVQLQVLGQHNQRNAAAAAAAAWAAGCSADAIARGLSTFEPVPGRMAVAHHGRHGWVIDDTYNANPDSVRAAIQVLHDLARVHEPSLPTCLVLGDMGEVGDQGPAYHAEVGEFAYNLGIRRMVVVGQQVAHTADAFQRLGGQVDRCPPCLAEDVHVLTAPLLQALTAQPHIILVKGSRFMRMERAVRQLTTVLRERDHAS